MRIVFAGTPEFAAHPLAALIASEFDVVAVYCQPDRPKGRGKQLIAPPTKQLAVQHNIPVYQPLNFREQSDRDQLAALNLAQGHGPVCPATDAEHQQALIDIVFKEITGE